MAYDPQQLANAIRSALTPQDVTSFASDPYLFPKNNNASAQRILSFLGSNIGTAQGDPLNFARRLMELKQQQVQANQPSNPIGQYDERMRQRFNLMSKSPDFTKYSSGFDPSSSPYQQFLKDYMAGRARIEKQSGSSTPIPNWIPQSGRVLTKPASTYTEAEVRNLFSKLKGQ